MSIPLDGSLCFIHTDGFEVSIDAVDTLTYVDEQGSVQLAADFSDLPVRLWAPFVRADNTSQVSEIVVSRVVATLLAIDLPVELVDSSSEIERTNAKAPIDAVELVRLVDPLSDLAIAELLSILDACDLGSDLSLATDVIELRIAGATAELEFMQILVGQQPLSVSVSTAVVNDSAVGELSADTSGLRTLLWRRSRSADSMRSGSLERAELELMVGEPVAIIAGSLSGVGVACQVTLGENGGGQVIESGSAVVAKYLEPEDAVPAFIETFWGEGERPTGPVEVSVSFPGGGHEMGATSDPEAVASWLVAVFEEASETASADEQA
jgi:hypothetical protein